jgi:hypothetical protein
MACGVDSAFGDERGYELAGRPAEVSQWLPEAPGFEAAAPLSAAMAFQGRASPHVFRVPKEARTIPETERQAHHFSFDLKAAGTSLQSERRPEGARTIAETLDVVGLRSSSSHDFEVRADFVLEGRHYRLASPSHVNGPR